MTKFNKLMYVINFFDFELHLGYRKYVTFIFMYNTFIYYNTRLNGPFRC